MKRHGRSQELNSYPKRRKNGDGLGSYQEDKVARDDIDPGATGSPPHMVALKYPTAGEAATPVRTISNSLRQLYEAAVASSVLEQWISVGISRPHNFPYDSPGWGDTMRLESASSFHIKSFQTLAALQNLPQLQRHSMNTPSQIGATLASSTASRPNFDEHEGLQFPYCATYPKPDTSPVVSGKDMPMRRRLLVPLSLAGDNDSLTGYQRLVRDQIYLFEAGEDDVESNQQGRNRPIVSGQVGLICRHCKKLPAKQRPKGAMYFPAKLQRIYQAAQNMAVNHFAKSCERIPSATRVKLRALKEERSAVIGGGKNYWAKGAMVLGISETEHGLVQKEEQTNCGKLDHRLY